MQIFKEIVYVQSPSIHTYIYNMKIKCIRSWNEGELQSGEAHMENEAKKKGKIVNYPLEDWINKY